MVADQMMEKENGNQLMIEIFVKYRGIQKRGERASCIAYPYADRVVLKALLEKTDKYDIHGKIFR